MNENAPIKIFVNGILGEIMLGQGPLFATVQQAVRDLA